MAKSVQTVRSMIVDSVNKMTDGSKFNASDVSQMLVDAFEKKAHISVIRAELGKFVAEGSLSSDRCYVKISDLVYVAKVRAERAKKEGLSSTITFKKDTNLTAVDFTEAD